MLKTELAARIRQIEIHTKRLVDGYFAGEYRSIFKGHGMEFDEVRPYQVGDEVRMIDWNVTARVGHPYVKQHIEERELTVMLLVDASASEDFGSVNRFKRDVAAEMAAVLSFAAINNQDRVGLIIFTDHIELSIPPRKGRKHALRVIREVLTFDPQSHGTDIRTALNAVNHILKQRTIVFLISDFLIDPESYRKELAITNRRHDTIVVELQDPLEQELSDVGLLVLEDPETGKVRWVDTSSKMWRRAFSQQIGKFEAAKNNAFRQAGTDRILISTDKDFTLPLANFFKDRTGRIRHKPVTNTEPAVSAMPKHR